jgi:hypothetical protein
MRNDLTLGGDGFVSLRDRGVSFDRVVEASRCTRCSNVAPRGAEPPNAVHQPCECSTGAPAIAGEARSHRTGGPERRTSAAPRARPTQDPT